MTPIPLVPVFGVVCVSPDVGGPTSPVLTISVVPELTIGGVYVEVWGFDLDGCPELVGAPGLRESLKESSSSLLRFNSIDVERAFLYAAFNLSPLD